MWACQRDNYATIIALLHASPAKGWLAVGEGEEGENGKGKQIKRGAKEGQTQLGTSNLAKTLEP